MVEEETCGEQIKCGSFNEGAEVTSSYFGIFECEVVCIQTRISLAAVVSTFAERQLSAAEILS